MRTLTNAGLGERITACLHNAAPGVSRTMGLPSFFVIKLPRMWIWNQLDQNTCIIPQKRADWDRDFLQKPTAFLQHSAKDRFLLQLAAQPDTIEGTTNHREAHMKNTSLCYLERGGQYLMLHRVKKTNY